MLVPETNTRVRCTGDTYLLTWQAGCDAQQMYGNDSAVAEGLQHAYSLDLQLYAHARMLFCRALARATSTTP